MPARVARLPRNAAGYPIPWFVATLDDGTRDFRVADAQRRVNAYQFRKCWVCGGTVGKVGAVTTFVIGPMCVINRVTAEPGTHRDCARYSALACPFLATPAMRRRTTGLPDDMEEPAGIALSRNPGVTAVYYTRTFRRLVVPMGGPGRPGWLISLGAPTAVEWYTQGRVATGDEVRSAIDAGLPALRDMCTTEDDPAAALAELDQQTEEASRWVPAA